MTRNVMPERPQPTVAPLDEEVDHVRGPSSTPLIIEHALEDDDLQRYAAQLELDLERFDHDRTGADVLGRIGRDIESGIASGEVGGTPTLFIEGVVHLGGYDAAVLMEALAASQER